MIYKGQIGAAYRRDLARRQVYGYTPGSHKTEHTGRQRRIYLGPRAQEVVLPYLDLNQA